MTKIMITLLSVTVFLLQPLIVEGRENIISELAQDAESEFGKSSEYQCVENYPCFEINLDYPDRYDTSQQLPWTNIDFKSEPERYMDAIRKYAVEGNIDVDWNVKNNAVRKWFHAPWMHRGTRGREPVRGLTRERGSRWHELSPQQTRRTNNWAVGFYNDRGGYEFGKVWINKAIPNTSDVIFPEGTLSVKLLFTDATNEEAPYLNGAGKGLTWHAQINRNAQPVPLRLLQVDIAVRDKNADNTTGWVFGTFMFDASKGNSEYWDNLEPVGLHWGNDPSLTRKEYDTGKRPVEGWVKPSVARMFASHRPPSGDLGYLARMNGPVDNPFSSCLGCHARAVDTSGGRGPAFTPNLGDMCIRQLRKDGNTTFEIISGCAVSEDAEQRIGIFFRNLKPGEPFLPNTKSLDYSLQMADGIAHWNGWFNENYPNQFETAFPQIAPLEAEKSITTLRLPDSMELQIPTLPLEKAFGRGDEDL